MQRFAKSLSAINFMLFLNQKRLCARGIIYKVQLSSRSGSPWNPRGVFLCSVMLGNPSPGRKSCLLSRLPLTVASFETEAS